MSKFSVITPSYNGYEYLPLCVASVADQKGGDVEHFICDGGSSDGTVEWLRSVTGAKDNALEGELSRMRDDGTSYVIRWRSEPDKGMYDAVNKGLKQASGEFCAYLNCDEQYLPDVLRTISGFLDIQQDVNIVIGDVVVVDEHGDYLFQREMLMPSRTMMLLIGMQTLTCAIFFRRFLLEKHDMFYDTSWRDGADAIWLLKALELRLGIGMIKQFTSAFSETGKNMNLGENAAQEKSKHINMLHPLAWRFRHAFLLTYRIRRLLAGHYMPRRHEYSIYTRNSEGCRVKYNVEAPTFRWKTREISFWPDVWKHKG